MQVAALARVAEQWGWVVHRDLLIRAVSPPHVVMYSSASQFWLAPIDEVLVDILGLTVPLAARLEGVRGHFFVANALFYRDADVCLNYVDPKHQFRFGANLVALPDGLHVQVSRTL